jgi:hypothetical protein
MTGQPESGDEARRQPATRHGRSDRGPYRRRPFLRLVVLLRLSATERPSMATAIVITAARCNCARKGGRSFVSLLETGPAV